MNSIETDMIVNTRKNYFLVLAAAVFLWTGCSATKTLNDPTTNATLWMQNAAEYDALTTTIYQAAASRLDTALHTPTWTADLNQKEQNYRQLPPAVILDVDETVLDNSPFQARLIKNHQSYTPDKWNAWVREEKADAIPGALAFTKAAAAKGITVFYITNRDASVEQSTYDNLKKHGFPLADDTDVLLTKNEQEDWTSAKVNRRKHVADHYRILMLIGDNLNDLLSADDITHEQRKALVNKHKQLFGLQWFILPNPVYGSWEQALYDFDGNLSASEKARQKREILHTKN